MPGRSTQSRPLTYVGVLIAAVALVGTLLLGWQWGGDDPIPTVIGAGVALIAVGWTVYSKLDT